MRKGLIILKKILKLRKRAIKEKLEILPRGFNS